MLSVAIQPTGELLSVRKKTFFLRLSSQNVDYFACDGLQDVE